MATNRVYILVILCNSLQSFKFLPWKIFYHWKFFTNPNFMSFAFLKAKKGQGCRSYKTLMLKTSTTATDIIAKASSITLMVFYSTVILWTRGFLPRSICFFLFPWSKDVPTSWYISNSMFSWNINLLLNRLNQRNYCFYSSDVLEVKIHHKINEYSKSFSKKCIKVTFSTASGTKYWGSG